MSREILFRGKTKKNDWVYGFYVKNSRSECLIVQDLLHVDGWEYNSEEYEVIPETVGQFTGLLDKNGKKIFEGDILLTDTIPQFVRFNEYLACWGVAQSLISATMSFDKSWPIIGNIHDNPELIGKEDSDV